MRRDTEKMSKAGWLEALIRGLWTTAVCALVWSGLGSGQAHAQDGFNVQLFRPSPFFGKTVTLYPAGHKSVFESDHHLVFEPEFGFYLNYQNDAFISTTNTNTLGQSPSSLDLLSMDLTGAIHIFDWLAFGIGYVFHPLAFDFTYNQTTGFDVLGKRETFVSGDLVNSIRVTLLDEESHGIALAAVGTVLIPTGSAVRFLGDDSVQVGGTFAVQKSFLKRFVATGNVGYESRENVRFFNLTLDDNFIYGAGLSYDMLTDVILIGELRGRATRDAFFKDTEETPLELLLAGRFLSFSGFAATLGVSFGIVNGFGTSDIRFVGGIQYHPEIRRRLYNDEDKDGIIDREDACPTIPEDFDGVLDYDGCPEDYRIRVVVKDLEGNVIPANVKMSPGLREGLDIQGETVLPVEKPGRYEISVDGGKKYISQKKQIVVTPDDLEVELRFRLTPTDADKITAKSKDQSGLIVIRKKLTTQFGFDSAQIPRPSLAALNNLVEFLKGNEAVYEIRIDGHADSVGTLEYNKGLSKRRAQSVKDYLSDRGVKIDLMETFAFGESSPVSDQETEEGRAANRRVEIIVFEKFYNRGIEGN